METSEVTKLINEKQIQPNEDGRILPSDELKRLTDLFSILIQIDQRLNKTKTNEKHDN